MTAAPRSANRRSRLVQPAGLGHVLGHRRDVRHRLVHRARALRRAGHGRGHDQRHVHRPGRQPGIGHASRSSTTRRRRASATSPRPSPTRRVTVKWQRSGGTNATVLRAPGRGGAKVSVVYRGPASSYRDTSVKQGVVYHYTVATHRCRRQRRAGQGRDLAAAPDGAGAGLGAAAGRCADVAQVAGCDLLQRAALPERPQGADRLAGHGPLPAAARLDVRGASPDSSRQARTSGTSGPGTAPAPPRATGACSAAARSASCVDPPQPGHAALGADRRPGARARLRQPRLPARRRPARSAGATTASAGSPAGSSSAAGSAGRSCSPAASRSSSSSTRRPRSPPATVRARSAAARTTSASARRGATIHPAARGADEIDEQLHAERVAPGTRTQLHHDARARRAARRRVRPDRRRAVAWSRATSCSAGRRPATPSGSDGGRSPRC